MLQVIDRNAKPLAISVDVPSVFANPSELVDSRAAARSLAAVLGLKRDVVYSRLASERLFVWLKRQVTPEVASKVLELNIPGVGITQESRRFYPNREVAAHLLGFTGVDDPYEPPLNPEIVCPTGSEPMTDSLARVVAYLEANGLIPAVVPTGE